MTDEPAASSFWRDAARGVVQTLPAQPAYAAVGLAFGVIAVDAGIAPWMAVAMSALIYAGTAQLAILPMIMLNLSPVAIIATAAVTMARYLVMSAALAPYLQRLSRWEKTAYAFHLVTLNFALHAATLPVRRVSKVEIFAVNIVTYLIWLGASVVGALAGNRMGDLDAYGIDYAMPAMFVALMVPMVRNVGHGVAAGVGGLAMLLLYAGGAAQWSILLAACIGGLAGYGTRKWTRRLSS